MKVMLIGSGAREHAFYKALQNSKHKPELCVYGTTYNPGVRGVDYNVGNLTDVDKVLEAVVLFQPDIALIGPEDPIAAGITDALEAMGVPVFAPNQKLAQIESSKSFARELLDKYKISGNPKYKVFTAEDSEQDIVKYLTDDLQGEYVIKYDGLYGGKGVKLSHEHLATVEDSVQFAQKSITEKGKVIIEEKLKGPEFSLIVFTDGQTVLPCPLVHDHKRAFDGDTGPNTGGMGSFSDANHLLPFISQEDSDQAFEIVKQTLKGLQAETQETYKGVLYGGFIKTKTGIKLIEFNARMGDPEAMNIMPLLKNDFYEVMTACINQKLHAVDLQFHKKASVCLYAVPDTYPDGEAVPHEEAVVKIPILDFSPNQVLYFSSCTRMLQNQEEYWVRLSQSRTLAYVCLADTIEEARQAAIKALKTVSGRIRFRTDIGSTQLIDKRKALLND